MTKNPVKRRKKNLKSVELFSSNIKGNIYLQNSTFSHPLDMMAIEVGQDLFVGEISSFGRVHLAYAKIEGHIEISNSTFMDDLNMESIQVRGGIDLIQKVSFETINLESALVNGTIKIKNAQFKGSLNMTAIEIAKHLLIEKSSTSHNLDLMIAKIAGMFIIEDCVFKDNLNFYGIHIGRELCIIKTNFNQYPIDITYADIGSFITQNSVIHNLDLTSTSITGEFSFDIPIQRTSATSLLLRNTTIGAIKYDHIDDWPERLSLQGLTYNRFDFSGSMEHFDNSLDYSNNKSTKENISRNLEWLERDEEYHPQPYEFLADYQKGIGFPSIGEAIRYASRERRRKEAWREKEYGAWLLLTLLKYTIGYGLGMRYFRVIYSFLILSVLGYLILIFFGSQDNTNHFDLLFSSFDNSLPLITLNEVNEELIFNQQHRLVIAFFYLQKLIGYALGGFLVAGLSGLTQKS